MSRPAQPLDIADTLTQLVEAGGSDLCLKVGNRPLIRVDGELRWLDSTAPELDPADTMEVLHSVLADARMKEFETLHEIDFAYSVQNVARFRVNAYLQRGSVSMVFRVVPNAIRSLAELGLPDTIRKLAEEKRGIILVTGTTGCGKSTTLAAIIDRINRTSARHIVSIEDPVEVLHQRDQSLITQREVGSHTPSFSAALRATLRQDPDVILVGELRDLDTIAFAVTAAETGHLVFGTVHTASVDTSIDRLISSFPAPRQPQVRTMLADTLRAASCQNLLRRAGGTGRTLAVEVMIANDAISNLIRKGKAFQIPAVITTSREQGMQLMDHELARLVRDGTVTAEEAFARAGDKRMFEALVSGAPAAAPSQPGAGLAGSLHPPSMTPPLRSRPPAGA
jgi:twitching motility protein PilT